MPVRMNGPLLKELVDAAGGAAAFVKAWLDEHPDDTIDKTNVSRWIRSKAWPKESAKFLRLAALLDVDPFALLAPDGTPSSVADRIINIVQNRRFIPPAVGFMHDFFGRQKKWPPSLTRDMPRWKFHEFRHDPTRRANCYALVLLTSEPHRIEMRPQTFHFAYRNPADFGGRWLQYGCVFRHRLKASLWHIKGQTGELLVPTLADPTPVKTWFGQGPAVFRVASLHPFDYSVTTDYSADLLAVEFTA